MAETTPPSLRDGAAESAPTAPHATPNRLGKLSGPGRFWDRKRFRRRAIATYVVAVAAHLPITPLTFVPTKSLEINDVEGDLGIPIDLLGEAEQARLEEKTAPASEPALTSALASKGPGQDAGIDIRDAEVDAVVRDAAPKKSKDAGAVPISDASADGASVAMLEDGGAGLGPRDPKAMIGSAGEVQAGPVNVQLLINMEEIRKHPTGKRIGPFFSAIKQWDEFIAGTSFDPVRDCDWMSMLGPSLYPQKTGRLVVLIRYSSSDAAMAKAMNTVATHYGGGGPFDAGVPRVKASIGWGDGAARVFMQPQPHLLAVSPPDFAFTAARQLSRAKVPAHLPGGEVVRVTVRDPSKHIRQVPSTLTELRLWGKARSTDGGLDIFIEGDAPDANAAQAAAEEMKALVQGYDTFQARLVVGALLSTIECSARGKVAACKLAVSKEQIDNVVGAAAAFLHVTLPP